MARSRRRAQPSRAAAAAEAERFLTDRSDDVELSVARTSQFAPAGPPMVAAGQQLVYGPDINDPDFGPESDVPEMEQLGGTGTSIFNGIITGEDYNNDFYWRNATRIFDTMRRNDGQVRAVLDAMGLPIERCQQIIVPGGNDAIDIEKASLTETALFHEMDIPWAQTLSQILLMLPFGFMPFEQVWQYKNGKLIWQRWAPRLPRTVWKWYIGDDNDLSGIQQYTYLDHQYKYINIPADKLILFTHRREGNNFEGTSVLRAAYKHWFIKDKLYTIQAMGIERAHVPIPVIDLPVGATEQDKQRARNLGRNLRANEALYAIMPDGFAVNWMSTKGRPINIDIRHAIEHQDIMIARTVGAQFVNLGSTETGAYTLAETQVSMFLYMLQSVVKNIEDTINRQAIRRMIDYNYGAGNTPVYPRLSLGEVSIRDVKDLAEALHKLGPSSGNPRGFIQPDDQLEDFIREEAGMPRAPQNLVQNTNVVTPEDPAVALPSTEQHPDQTSTGDAAVETGIASPPP